MGLDMYLEARKFVSGWNHRPEEERELYKNIVESVGMGHVQDDRFATVNVNVGYWRKANHIHDWFVNNVQDGEDDCKSYHVSREQLMELIEICERVHRSGDPDLAEELLPTASGFFFGDTQYDEYYFEETERTAKMLGKLVAEAPTDVDFYYSSSW
jgi:hypothetical protein